MKTETEKRNRMKGGVRRRGERGLWSFTLDRGLQPAQRCLTCRHREWLAQKPLKACPACGGELQETWERRQDTNGGFATRAEAVAARDAARVDVQQGTYATAGKTTMAEYFNDVWLPSLEADSLRASTIASYRTQVRQHIVPRLGHVRLAEVNGAMLGRFYGFLAKEGRKDGRGLAPASARRVRAILHAAFADAVASGLLTRNPADMAGRRKRRQNGAGKRERQAKIKAWNREQLLAFLESARTDRLHPLWHPVAATGMRREEALGLVWQEVDLEAGKLHTVRTRVPVGGTRRRRRSPTQVVER